jgi:hypothetical protein
MGFFRELQGPLIEPLYKYGGAALTELFLDANAVRDFIYRLDGLVARGANVGKCSRPQEFT